jgi:hypothetical protein
MLKSLGINRLMMIAACLTLTAAAALQPEAAQAEDNDALLRELGSIECALRIGCDYQPNWVCIDGLGGFKLNYCNLVGGPFEEECGWN